MNPMHTSSGEPLEGIRVLDLSRLLPGPYCSQLLADLGAEVIKVETPLAGDYARMAPRELGFGGLFEAVNHGKQSIAVDYRRPAGRDIVLRLAATADVFIESSRPGQMEKRGLGQSDVLAVNPDIIYCSLSGFGQSGPYRDKPGHDIDYLAVSGMLSLLGPDRSDPAPPAMQLADISAGMLAAFRILAALVGRERGDAGSHLDIAIIDAAVSWLDMLGTGAVQSGTASGALCGTYPCYTTYRCADGRWLAVGALEMQFWASFCRGLGRSDLVSRRFDTEALPEVAALMATRTTADWLETFDDEACVARVNLPSEALADPHIEARRLTAARAGSAPGLGADTQRVLAAEGVAEDELAALQRSGAIALKQTPERAARAARLGSMLTRRAEREAVLRAASAS